MRILKKMFRYAFYVIFRPVWWLERLVPRDRNSWVFGAWYGQRYSDNSKWLFEHVLEHHPEIRATWITKSRSVYGRLRAAGKPVCMSASPMGAWRCLRARYAFLSSGFVDMNFFFLNGARQIWLWHGMPLKKIGYCDDSAGSRPSPLRRRLSALLNPYSRHRPHCTLTSADFFTPFLQESFRLSRECVLATGLPRCDAFFRAGNERLVSSLRERFPGSRVLLYMPTFRMSIRMDGEPFNPFTAEFGFDGAEFTRFLERENLVFLYKPHFVDSAARVSMPSERFMCVGDDDFGDLYVLLGSVDALMTDYSSVYFDFLAARKPVYLLTFDYDRYIRDSRAHFFDMRAEMHGTFCLSWQDFYAKAADGASDVAGLEEDRKKFAQYLDGSCCENVVERILMECANDFHRHRGLPLA